VVDCRRLTVVALVVLGGLLGTSSTAAARPGFVERPKIEVGDSDGDGMAEASATGIAGAPCACRCPVMVAAVGGSAAGQDLAADTRNALVVCGTKAAVGLDPNAPELTPPRAEGRLKLQPGGLGRGGPAG
jgi:hypothetical protein